MLMNEGLLSSSRSPSGRSLIENSSLVSTHSSSLTISSRLWIFSPTANSTSSWSNWKSVSGVAIYELKSMAQNYTCGVEHFLYANIFICTDDKHKYI